MPDCIICSAPPAGTVFASIAPHRAWTARMDPARVASDAGASSLTLLEAVAAGDRTRCRRCTSAPRPSFTEFACACSAASPKREDALQDAYVTVWRNAARFDPGKAGAITWLAVVARNKAIDRLRRRTLPTEAIDAAAEIADDGPTAFDLVQQGQDSARLAGCLDELEEQAAGDDPRRFPRWRKLSRAGRARRRSAGDDEKLDPARPAAPSRMPRAMTDVRLTPEERAQLAAEYALGVLAAEDLAQARALDASDGDFAPRSRAGAAASRRCSTRSCRRRRRTRCGSGSMRRSAANSGTRQRRAAAPARRDVAGRSQRR